MDFGLAQLAERSQLTKTATLLGTPAYMSPEQAQESATDRRTDIWSLGIVIYEMVTGKLPFERERLEAVLYAIGNEEPESITALRAGLPMELERIVSKALAKRREERYQHVDEMVVDLRSLEKKSGSRQSVSPKSGVGLTPRPHEGPYSSSAERKLKLYQAMVVVTGIAALALGFLYFGGNSPKPDKPSGWLARSPKSAPSYHVSVNPPAKTVFVPAGLSSGGSAISPAGTMLAFVARADRKTQLWVRRLDSLAARPLPGTEGAYYPFWSPDSRFLGFFYSDHSLKKSEVAGGPPQTLCDAALGRGGSWSSRRSHSVRGVFYWACVAPGIGLRRNPDARY